MKQQNKPFLLCILLFILILLIFLILIFFSNPDAKDASFSDNYVTNVIDGDTFKIYSGETIRLLCVDTPEENDEGYEEAKSFLENLILNKEVILNSSITDKDKYGRLLRYVSVNGASGLIFVNKLIIDDNHGELLIIPPEECKKIIYS